MKNLLLFCLSATLAIGLQAQRNPNRNAKISPRKLIVADMYAPVNPNPGLSRSGKEGTFVGKSGNIYTALLEYQHCLNYDPASGLIQMIHRGDPETYPIADNSAIISSQSTDNGTTWDYKILVPYENNVETRYPQGFIYNGEESTDPSEVIIGATGPAHNNSAWDKNFLVSATNDDELTGYQLNYVDMHTSPQSFSKLDAIRYGTDVCDDGYVYALGGLRLKDNDWENFDLDTYRGLKDGNHIVFGEDRISTIDALAATERWWGEATQAWSQDGSIGYIFGVGLLNEFVNQSAYNPVVWKSTDSGETWELLIEGMNMVDFPGLEDFLAESDDGHYIPLFKGGVTGVVDINGDLQFFGECYSGSTLAVSECHIPSEADEYVHLFNVTINPESGITGFKFLTNFESFDVSDDSEYAYAAGVDGIGWTHRLQAGLAVGNYSYTGYCYVVYGDTPDAENLYGGENAHPDLYIGIVSTVYPSPPLIFRLTENGENWFHYSAKKAIFYGLEMGYDIFLPVTTTVNNLEMQSNTDMDPVTISFIGDFSTGINEAGKETTLHIYPNPARKLAKISLASSNKPENTSLEVIDMVGKPVIRYAIPKSQTETTLNVASWEKGIYFVIIRAGGEVVGRSKFVVD